MIWIFLFPVLRTAAVRQAYQDNSPAQSLFMVLKSNKNPDEILQEEFLQERAAVLGRAGESVFKALEKLTLIERRLESHLQELTDMGRNSGRIGADSAGRRDLRIRMIAEINREINRFNRAREYALVRYYYLIVTREAMGMRRHHWVEQEYAVPPKKKHLRMNENINDPADRMSARDDERVNRDKKL